MTMFALTFLGDILVFIAGGAFVWFCKDWMQRMVIGANALSKKLHGKADAIALAAKLKV